MIYYNENDKFAANKLRERMANNLIPQGFVDERSIEDVKPSDLTPYTQCHFFAGIGVWAYALEQAGWAKDRKVWTGSCPCQPFSTAGTGKGVADKRHLWPAWNWLIEQCRPDTIFGEQVASKDARAWLDVVSTDLEQKDYAVGSAATVACGFGAPHKRQRIYFVGDSQVSRDSREYRKPCSTQGTNGAAAWEQGENGDALSGSMPVSNLPNPLGDRREGGISRGQDAERQTVNGSPRCHSPANDRGPTNGFWGDVDWIECRDEKWRSVEPGSFPLVDGAPGRMGLLRGYGNAIVAPQAIAFVESFLEIALPN